MISMREERQNPVFVLWLAAYEEQLTQVIEGAYPPAGKSSPAPSPTAPDFAPEVTSE